MEVRFVEVAGARSRYYHAGEGDRRLLLVHGFGMCADAWTRCIDGFADDFEVFAPDLPGHGDSEWATFADGSGGQRLLVDHLGRFPVAPAIGRW